MITARGAARIHRLSLPGLILTGVFLSIFPTATTSWALSFGASHDDSEWRLTPSIFECVFSQPIPDYGEAVFYHQAGEDLEFYLKVKKNLMAVGDAALHIESPYFKPSTLGRNLGYVKVKDTRRPIRVDSFRANQMLTSLLKGQRPTFTRRAYFDAMEAIRVSVSSYNFEPFYEDYLGCVTGLLPVNFDQVARTKVNFKSGQKGLRAEDKAKMDLVILYIKADPRVKALYIDGHSDSVGRRYFNRRLSEERALLVSNYFIEKGIDESMITTRYHGQRYPVATNATKQGRYQNRRVTMRLEREEVDDPDRWLDLEVPRRTRR